MELSTCIFTTGTRSTAFSSPAQARDAVDELFTHSDGISEPFLAELRALGIQLPPPPLRVVSLVPGRSSEPFTLSMAHDFAAEMKTKLQAALDAEGLFYYVSGRIQGVVSVTDDAEMKQLYDALDTMVRTEPETTRPHAAISNPYDTIADISRACDENQEAHRFERFLMQPINVLLQSGDFWIHGAEGPQYEDEALFGKLSQGICNALAAEEPNRAHQLLDDALDFMVDRFPRVSGVHMRALRFCHALEMTLVGADLIDRLFVQENHLPQDVIEADNEEMLRKTFHRKLEGIDTYARSRKQLRHGALMRRVAAYIDSNLTDAMLSLPTIAESFGMSVEKLSGSFRSYYQETVPNFIHQRRVEHIKKQLLGTKKTVRELALEAGYVSLATMNRAFYRLEGMYPGQYRSKYRALRKP